jgi:hypothetical protein
MEAHAVLGNHEVFPAHMRQLVQVAPLLSDAFSSTVLPASLALFGGSNRVDAVAERLLHALLRLIDVSLDAQHLLAQLLW